MRNYLHAAVLVLIASVVHAQPVTPHDDQRVTVRAEGVPIATLLSELARLYPLEKLSIDEAVQQRLVSVVLEGVSLDVALVGILKASGLHFAMSGRRVIVGDWTAAAGRVSDQPAGPLAEEARVVEQAAMRAGEVAAEQQAISDAAGDESTILPTMPVAFVANGENVTYLEPNFVPYKMRPEVRARRMATDVAMIP
jgi:hypothetical protein